MKTLIKRTAYFDKDSRTVIIPVQDRKVTINIFNRMRVLPKREVIKRTPDNSYNVKRMIEQTNGIKNILE